MPVATSAIRYILGTAPLLEHADWRVNAWPCQELPTAVTSPGLRLVETVFKKRIHIFLDVSPKRRYYCSFSLLSVLSSTTTNWVFIRKQVTCRSLRVNFMSCHVIWTHSGTPREDSKPVIQSLSQSQSIVWKLLFPRIRSLLLLFSYYLFQSSVIFQFVLVDAKVFFNVVLVRHWTYLSPSKLLAKLEPSLSDFWLLFRRFSGFCSSYILSYFHFVSSQ